MMKNLTCVIASNKMSPVSLQRVVRKHKVWHSNNHFNNISCTNFLILFVCLFMVFRPTREFFTDMETSPFPAANFDLCSALVAIEEWGASVHNDHLRGPVTLTRIAERLAVRLSLPVFTSWVCRDWDSNTQSSACERLKL